MYRNRIAEHITIDAAELRKNPLNHRRHPDTQRAALRSLLGQVGIVDELLAYRDPVHGLTLVDGEARWSEGGSWPVAVLDLTPDEAMTVLAMLDKIGADAEIDPDALLALLDSLPRDARQTAGAAWTDDELAALIGSALPEPGAGGDEFDPTPEDGPTRAQLGDLWSIGGVHRLLVGDCTDAANVARLMEGERAALCVTDPPYMVNYDPDWRNDLPWQKDGTANGQVIQNDDSLEWLKAFDTTPYDVAYIWMASTTIARLQPYLEERNFILRYLIVWNKDLMVLGRGDYHWKHEVCLYMVRKGATGNWQGARDQKTVWEIPTIHSFKNGHNSDVWGLEGHGNQKPIECMQRPIENNSATGDLIYDPFLGSGTTLIAAHRTGRRCYGMEISPRYADVILRRAEAEGLECIRHAPA